MQLADILLLREFIRVPIVAIPHGIMDKIRNELDLVTESALSNESCIQIFKSTMILHIS